MADDAVRAKAAKILADVRAGTHSHGDIRDVGKLLDGKWDQDFPTALLEIASRTLNNSDDAVRAALKPCPFCGGDAELSNLVDADDYFVSCKNCEVQQIANYKAHDAVNRWNIRAHTLAGAGEVERKLLAVRCTCSHVAKSEGDHYAACPLRLAYKAADLIAAQRERIAEAEGLFVDACQLLDVIKQEWSAENAWSEWDQGVRDRISAWLKIEFDSRAALGSEG